MNKHQIDRLFEEKLGAAQQEPSDKAKARFDQLLAQKHKKPVLIWWRVAAALLLLAVSTVTYLSWPAGEEQPMTADLPEIATDPIATTTDPVAESADSPAVIPDREVEETTDDPVKMSVPQTQVTLAANQETLEEQSAPSDVMPTVPNVNDIAEVASTIAVAGNNEKEPEESQTEAAGNIETTEALSVELSTEVAIAANEPAAEEVPKKKRLPVTIIYKSSSADQSLVAMQDIRDDVDTLSGSDNSLKSILQNAGNGSLFAEFKKAKEDLFNLDIPLKTKKVEN